MKIGGLQRFSLIDYPGRICATVFTQGCNFRCPYCHNSELVDPDRYSPLFPEAEVMDFLAQRRGKLEAVTVTGGEPTLQEGLPDFLARVKDLGYLTKVDTNGSQPEIIAQLTAAGLVDYWAMDLKGPLSRYRQLVAVPVALERIGASIDLLLKRQADYEFRTTVAASQLSPGDLVATAAQIPGARLYVLQPFIPSKTLDPAFLSEPPCSSAALRALEPALEGLVERLMFR
ncbi:MAG: anaerobic ribonucleoside-triphosphate reductase activating protein [Syntrophaceae bacterium]|nr:anaerobic ribonucleoside-triphosphate reductase activating protein [Syntrophaceae bacterium]